MADSSGISEKDTGEIIGPGNQSRTTNYMSDQFPTPNKNNFLSGTYWLCIVGSWTLVVAVLCGFAIFQSKKTIVENALLEARTSIDKDLTYRKWVSEQGGVYVTPTDRTPPNPYLQLPNRDVVTTGGKKLTLINPAYMTRQVHESATGTYGIRAHLTSLRPIRPENKPDPWEDTALRQIEKGAKEVTLPLVEIDGKPFLRQMRGFVTEKSCLRCHAFQGYSEGDIRGGISVSVPLESYYALYRADRNGTALRYSIVWIIGIGGILVLRGSLKRSSLALQEQEYVFRDSQQAAMVGSYKFDFTNDFWESSEVLEEIFGIDGNYPKDLQGWLEIVHADDREMMARYVNEQVLAHRQPFEKDYRVIRKSDGEQRWVLGLGKLRFDADGRPTAMIGTIQDITQRKQAEQELRQSYDLLSYIIKHNTSALAVHDKDLKYLFVSERYLEHYKLKDRDIIGKHHYDIFPDLPQKWRAVHQKALQGISSCAETDRYEREDGTVDWTTWECHPWYEAGGEVGGFVLYTQVVTDRVRADEQKLELLQQLHQAQKMESIGRLAGGVAHDFNNMLSVILGHAELGLLRADVGQQVRADLEAIRNSAERSANLTRQLLAFARIQAVSPKVVDLNEVVGGMLQMLQRLIGESISINWHPAPGLWQVRIDTSQLDQILANLFVNARDAIENVGKIVIGTRNVSASEDVAKTHADLEPGNYVELSISDSGCGMSNEVISQIFEPFFTTKELGKGTGLGLSTVYGAVTQNHGFIYVDSELGVGTTFRIYLPRNSDRTEEESPALPAEPSPKGHATILLVEDEPAILNMAKSILEMNGYQVIEAATPTEAVILAGEHAGAIDLLITDVIMPEMNGRELATSVLALHPEAKQLFMSGYTADVIAHHGVLDEGVHFIQKPFSMDALLTKVREVLNL